MKLTKQKLQQIIKEELFKEGREQHIAGILAKIPRLEAAIEDVERSIERGEEGLRPMHRSTYPEEEHALRNFRETPEYFEMTSRRDRMQEKIEELKDELQELGIEGGDPVVEPRSQEFDSDDYAHAGFADSIANKLARQIVSEAGENWEWVDDDLEGEGNDLKHIFEIGIQPEDSPIMTALLQNPEQYFDDNYQEIYMQYADQIDRQPELQDLLQETLQELADWIKTFE